MIIYGTINRQIFTRRLAVYRGVEITAKDNGDGTATCWLKAPIHGWRNKWSCPIDQVTFTND